MKPVRLAAIALQAERVRWKHAIRRLLVQAILGAVALGVVLAGVVFGQFALYQLLQHRLPPAGAAGVLAGADLLIALVIVWIAASLSPGEAEREAQQVSTTAQEGIRQSLDWTQYFNWKTFLWIYEIFRSRKRD